MSIKKIKIIDIFLIFGLCFLTHFGYSILPNSLTSIFFPVNESTWEHMKMIFTAILIISLFDYFIFKKYNIKNNNIIFSAFISSTLSIPIFLGLYLPFYNVFQNNIFLNITVLFITILISQIISYNILIKEHIKCFNYISIIGIIFIYIIFSLLTYFPPNNDLFLDIKENKYGINHYAI